MITFTELLKQANREKIAIHTPTEEQANALLKELDIRGLKWRDGDRYELDYNHWWFFEESTCYCPFRGMFGLYKDYVDEGSKIIEFEDVEFD